MKQKLFYGAMAAMMLTACSQDEILKINEDEISFNVSSIQDTRAADSYCNNFLPSSFRVWAQNTDSQDVYFGGELVVNKGGNPAVWGFDGGQRYWPNNNLNFYAEVNGDNEFNYNDGAPKFENFQVKDNVREQVDLMYGVKLNQGKENTPVNLNFRHALSQVAFRAKNTNPKINVEVTGVSVGHIGNQATFSFPTVNTDQNWEDVDHSDNPHDVTLPGQGTWTDAQASALKQYDVTFDAVTLTSDVKSLTCPGDNHTQASFANTLTLIPQQVAAWNPEVKGNTFNGAYFLVKCKISNIAGEQYNALTDKVLYDGYAAIPVEINWEQGKRYIYTFNFANGTGGYTPDPDDPQPVLNKIDFDLTVDDFIPVDNGDQNMDSNDSQKETTMYTVNYDNGWKIQSHEGYDSYSFKTLDAVPVKEGYNFKGWSTTENGEVEYVAGQDINLTKANPTLYLYSVWEAQTMYTYTLTFDANNGTNVTNIPEKITITSPLESYEFTIPNVTPQKPNGWTFLYWTAVQDDNTVKYEIGNKVTVTKDAPNATVYGYWKGYGGGGTNPGAGGDNPWGNKRAK